MGKVLNILKIVLYFLLLLLIVLFSIMNSDLIDVSFDFFPFNFVIQIRLFLLIIFCFVIGFLMGIITGVFSIISKNFKNWKNERKIKKMEETIEKNKADGVKNEKI